jgi:hypothetical protein
MTALAFAAGSPVCLRPQLFASRGTVGTLTPTCSLGSRARAAGIAASVAALLLAAPGAQAQMGRDVLVFDHDQGLSGADFSGRQDLVGAIFSKANCKGARFVGADLRNAQLDDTVLIEAVMDGADCTNVLATKAKFQKASLRDVNFTNANLISAVLGGADVTGADFTDALIEPAVMMRLCERAAGTNSKTEVSTRESLMCSDLE